MTINFDGIAFDTAGFNEFFQDFFFDASKSSEPGYFASVATSDSVALYDDNGDGLPDRFISSWMDNGVLKTQSGTITAGEDGFLTIIATVGDSFMATGRLAYDSSGDIVGLYMQDNMIINTTGTVDGTPQSGENYYKFHTSDGLLAQAGENWFRLDLSGDSDNNSSTFTANWNWLDADGQIRQTETGVMTFEDTDPSKPGPESWNARFSFVETGDLIADGVLNTSLDGRPDGIIFSNSDNNAINVALTWQERNPETFVVATFDTIVKDQNGRDIPFSGALLDTDNDGQVDRVAGVQGTNSFDKEFTLLDGDHFQVTNYETFNGRVQVDDSGNPAGLYVASNGSDTTPPTVTSFNPADAATGVAVGSDIVLTFSEEIQSGTGWIQIHRGSAWGPVVASYDVATNTKNLVISGNTLKINPTSDLANNTLYYVTLADGSIRDFAGNNLTGISTYDFRTVAKYATYVVTPTKNSVDFFVISPAVTGMLYDTDANGEIDRMRVVSTSTDQSGHTNTYTQAYQLQWSDTTHWTAHALSKYAFGAQYDEQGRPKTIFMNGAEQTINWESTVVDGVVATVSLVNGSATGLLQCIDTNGDNFPDQTIYTETTAGVTSYTAHSFAIGWTKDGSDHYTSVTMALQTSSNPTEVFSGSVTGSNRQATAIQGPSFSGGTDSTSRILISTEKLVDVFLISGTETGRLYDINGDGVIDSMDVVNTTVDQSGHVNTRINGFALTWSDSTHWTAHAAPELVFGSTYDVEGRPMTVIMNGGEIPVTWMSTVTDGILATVSSENDGISSLLTLIDSNSDGKPDVFNYTEGSGFTEYTAQGYFDRWAIDSNNHATSVTAVIQLSSNSEDMFSGSVTGSGSHADAIQIPSFSGGSGLNSFVLISTEKQVDTFRISSTDNGRLYDLDGNGVVDRMDVVSATTDQSGHVNTNVNSFALTWSDSTHWTAHAAPELVFGSTYDVEGKPLTVIMNGGEQPITWMSPVIDGVLATITIENDGFSSLLTLIDSNSDGRPDMFSYTEGSGLTEYTAQGYLDRWVFDSSNHPTAVTVVIQTSSDPADIFSGSVTGSSNNPATIVMPLMNSGETTGDRVTNDMLIFDLGITSPQLDAQSHITVRDADFGGRITSVTLCVDSLSVEGSYLQVPLSGIDASGNPYSLLYYGGSRLLVNLPAGIVGQPDPIVKAWEVNSMNNGGISLSPMTVVTTGSGTNGSDWVSGTTGSESINAGAGNDLIEWSGGNDTVDAGDGYDAVNLPLSSTDAFHWLDDQKVLHIGAAIDNYQDVYHITKNSDTSFRIDKVGVDGKTVESTMNISNAESMGFGNQSHQLQVNYAGVQTVVGTPWNDQIFLNAANLDNLMQVWGDLGHDTLVINVGSGYSNLELVNSGAAYILKGTLISDGSVVELGHAEPLTNGNGAMMTLGTGENTHSFAINDIEAFRFVSDTVTLDFAPDSLSNNELSFDLGVSSPELAASGQLTVTAASSDGYLSTVTLDVSQLVLDGSHLIIPMTGTDANGNSYWLDPYSGGELLVEIPADLVVGHDAQAHAWQVGGMGNMNVSLTPMNVVAGGAGTSGVDWVTGTSGDDIINAGAGDDFIEWRGGYDVVDAGDGYDTLHLPTNGMNYSTRLDAEGVLHIGAYSNPSRLMMMGEDSAVDAYRITKLGDASFEIDKMQGDGVTVDSTMLLSNAERVETGGSFGVNLVPHTFTGGEDGSSSIEGTPWDDEFSLDADNLGNLIQVYGDTGHDTLVMDLGAGYSKLELVKSGQVYLLQGTSDADGTVAELGEVQFSSNGWEDMTIGSGESAKSFSVGNIEAFHFVSGSTHYEVDPSQFAEIVFLSHTWGNEITGTAKDDTIDADALGLANHATTANDYIQGNGGNDLINAGAGDDHIYGNDGNDIIDGGAGNDRAYYNGYMVDYTITSHNGVWTVADTRDGSPDGTDSLTGIEYLSFRDTSFDIGVRFNPTSSSGNWSYNSITGSGFDDTIDADALAAANPWKGSQWVNVYFGTQPVYTLGVNEFSNIGTITFTDQELTDLSNQGLELWHGAGKVETSFTANAADIINQTDGAYTLHWIGTETQTDVPYSIEFCYDKEGVYSHNDYIYGNGGNDLINAGAGDDTIYGNGGNDTIEGGAGSNSAVRNDSMEGGAARNDTAGYNGNRADYAISNHDGVWTITDIRDGSPDGTDTLTGIEHLSFYDAWLDLNVRFTPTSDPGGESYNYIYGTVFDDTIDADALAAANPWKGSAWAYVNLAAQPVYTLGANEFSAIGTVTFTLQELGNLTNQGLELWHGADKVESSFTVSAADIINQTDGAYTLHWIGTETQTEAPSWWIGFNYDKEGVYSHNDNIYGNGGNDFINAGSGNDYIEGNEGNDTISGGAGNDWIDGGNGNNTVVFSGNYAEYTITHDVGSSSFTITDNVPGRDGTDVVTSVENFQFADGIRDITVPTVTDFSPADAATGVAVGGDIVVTFSEDIQRGEGYLYIHIGTADGDVVESFDVATSGNISITDKTLTINPTDDLATDTHYFVTFDNGSVKDLAGNSYEGTIDYDFTTSDTIAPVVNVFTPADGAVGVAIASDIVLTFSEDIQLGSGAIEIHSGSETGPLVASVAEGTIASSVTGSTLTLNPTDALVIGTHYFVTLDNGSVTDLAGNSYAGTTAYDFTTALFNFSFGGYNFPTVKSGFLGVGDPLNPDRAGCYWDRYELTGVANGTTVAIYMGDSWVDDYLMIERNGSIIARDDDSGNGERSYDAFLVWSYMAGDVIRATTYSAGDSGYYNLYLSVSDSYEGINAVPTLNTFDGVLGETNDSTALAITLDELKAHGDEADADGTVDSFVVKAITTGTLRIGFNAAVATPYSAVNNYLIDATHHAYWSPSVGSSGTINAFTVVARDNYGAESATPVQASVTVHAVPTLTEFTGGFGTTSEDSGELVEVTYATLQEQGNEADVDGTVEAFVVKSASGILRIGADAASATAWDALTNNTIDATHHAYWIPAANANGTVNAFAVVARDNSGYESITPVAVTVEVTPVNDPPLLGVGSNSSAYESTLFNHQIILGDPDPDTHHVTVNWGDGTDNTIFDTTENSPNISHNFADNGSYTVTVTADDQQGQANSAETGSFQVTVHNVAPVAPVTGVDLLNTGSSYTLHVGAVVDPGPDTRTGYSINWGDGTTNAFTPDEWVAAAGTFMHTYNASNHAETGRSITVNTTDEDGTFVLGSKYVTVNRPASDIYLDNARIAENSLPGTVVGTLYSSDDEGWWGHEYHLLDDAGGRFVLVGNQIKLAEGAALDYETAASFTIRVSSTDQGGLSFEKEIPISLVDVGPDLQISHVGTPPGVVDVDAGSSIEVSWTIATQGTEPSNATWYDQIYLDNPDTPWLDRWVGDFQTTAQLPLSGGLERIQTIQVPVDMQGHFRVVVLTDAYNNVAEGSAGETNNTTYGSVLFNVLNTNLEVESVTAPASGFAGREIEVQWVVNNTGNAPTPVRYWYDQIYLSSDTTLDGTDLLLGTVQNQSYLDIAEGYTSTARVTLPNSREGEYHILVKTDAYGHVPEGAGEGDNITASSVLDIQPIPLTELSDLAVVSVAAPLQALSGQNMSLTYTIDNAGLAPVVGNSTVWVERIYMSTDDVLDGGDRLLSTVWRDLAADKLPEPDGQSHFVTTQKVMLPVGVYGDAFYFFVTVTPVSPVSNAFQSNDVAYDTTPTLVRLTPPPDLEVSAISAPSPAIAGHDLSITYQVSNTGSTATPNAGWYDSIYLSRDITLDASDTKLTDVWHSGALESGGHYSNTATIRLAEGLEGSWYLIAATDSRNDVFELDNDNNVFASSAAITINSRPADLVVTEVSAPAAAQAGNSVRVSWTVLNQGVGYSSTEQWTDSVILSGDAVLGNGDDVWIGSSTHSGLLQAGQTYSNSALVSLPGNLSGQYQLFVVTDAYNQVYESNQNNNDAHSGLQIQAQPTADLQVSSVTAPLTIGSGDWLTVDYTVINAGLGRTNSEWWVDNVILSPDDIFGNSDDVNLGNVYHANRLNPNESYQGTGSFKLPIDLQGDYHVGVRTDAWGWVTEQNGENNNLGFSAGTMTVNLTATPDLLMSALQAADQGSSGQNLQLSWTVHNDGADTSGGWRQAFYLSRDGMLDRASDIYLGYAESRTALSAGADVVFNQSFRIPDGISGKYYVFGIVDSSDAIYERGGESNNTAMDATAVQITQPTPVDLVAGVITVPENGVPGALASISYTVTNESGQVVTGQWSDSIYLSSDAVWDVGDTLFARVGIYGGLDGNESYTQTATGAMPGLIGGDYYVIVRSDIFNQINETNEVNNLNASLDTTRMDVEALTLGTPDAASFAHGGAVYYRVDVAAGETLRFNFDRAATEGRTELFVSYDAMPSRSDFDFRYNQADSPDQSLVIANTRGGTYYVMAYNAAGATDAYSITADTLQFSITEIGTAAGSNKGQVTVRIDGAELTTHTTAMLVGPDGAEHEASQVYWKDGTELWATFDLRGLATDTYDVKVQDGARTALLNDSFTVNNGELGHVEYGMETPSALRPGQVGSVRVYYQNLGDTDVAAPLLTVSGNALLKLPGEAAFGGTSLQLLGINSEGPAGILSPGAEGSFQLFFTPDFAGGGTVNLGVSSLKPDQVIDWNTILDASKPENVSDESWATVKANLIAELGATTTDYQNNLAENATALDQLESRTDDVARLFSLDYMSASDSGALLRPTEPGVLGYSHTFAWDITATRQSDGSVVVDIAGAEEHFERQSDGSYKLVGQGTSTLTETGGVFEFHQQNGTRIVFNQSGDFEEILDSNGHGVQATYESGRLTQVVADNGNRLSFIYNGAGRLIQQTDQNGHTVTFAYDTDNQHLASATSLDGTTEYSYVTEAGAAQHRISSVTLADGTVQHFDYDASGRLIHEYLNDGAEAFTYSYVGVNEVVATDALGDTTHLWLNERGQIAQVEDALGHVSQLRYDANGNMTGIVNADGTSTGIEYDTAGNPLSVQNALGHTVDFAYEAQFGHLAQVTDQRGNAIDYGYDSEGNLNTITYADSSSESYSYDSQGYLHVAVNRGGESVTYTFDDHGHLTEKSYADGSTATFAYDGHGNLISAVDADSSTTFEYDAADRLVKTTDGDGRWLSYQYDAAGHRTEMADQTGHVTHYSYDDLGHLAQLTDGDGHLIASYSYDAAGQLSRGDNGNGTYTTYEYDAAGQLTHLVNHQADDTINSSFDYTYDAAGHRTSETTLEGTTSYEYDAIGQLTGATLMDGRHIAYNYDAAGNRTAVEDGGVTTNYSTNNLNEYTAVGSATYTYDADGNLTDKTESGVGTHYTYDVENHLLSVTTPTDTWNYEYDALGNRIASVHDGARTEYQLDPTGLVNVAGEYDGSGNLLAAYTYGFGLESQTLTGGSSYYYDYNAIGSTAGLSGSTGDYVNQYSYLPFGENLTTTETVANSFEYVGQWGVTDEGNGLDFMRARYYSVDIGKFTSEDPLNIFGGDLNLNRYVLNNPISLIDPSGLEIRINQNLTPDQRLERLRDLIQYERDHGTSMTAEHYNTTGGDMGYLVQNFDEHNIDSTYGGVDLDWVLTLVAKSQTTHIPPSILYPAGKIVWAISDVGYFLPHLQAMYNPAEVNAINIANDIYWGKSFEETFSNWDIQVKGTVSVVRPSDPNDMVGPQSFGDEHWTSSHNALPYTIHYENQASATAPAQEVTITQTLDSDLNAGSFRLGDFGWSDIYVDVPDGVSYYIDRIDLTATKGYMVDVIAGIDVTTHEAYWSFTTIDPVTGDIPVDPTIGFLPPDSDGSIGQGFVNYTVHAKTDASTGTVIDAQATIVFTTQEPIDTPAIFNTLDTVAPESHIEAVTETTVESAQFLVRWSGSDVGSAIAGYTVFVSDNGGAYSPWLENTTLTEATYAGQPGHTYAFYTVATDNAGNSEGVVEQSDLTILVTMDALPSDTVPPEIAAVILPGDGLYAAGQSLDFAVQFSETVFVDVAGLSPVIKLMVGATEVDAVYESGSGTDTLIFSHVVAAGEYDTDGIALDNAIVLNGANLRDTAGNPVVDLTFSSGSTDGIHVDNAPTLQTALVDQTGVQDHAFSFQVSNETFTDVDAGAGDSLSYTATLGNGDSLPDWLHFDADTLTFSGTPSSGDLGSISVTLTATDSSSATASDTFDLTVAAIHDLHGDVTFWNGGAVITDVTSTLTSVPAATGTQSVEFRNIQVAPDGTRTIEIWETSAQSVNSLQLELLLPDGSVAAWQDDAGLPAGWSSLTNAGITGKFILGGMGVTGLSDGPVKLGVLTLTAPTDPQHFDLILSKGQLGNEAIPVFGIASDSMTTGVEGLYQHIDMLEGSYALSSVKVAGASENSAVMANDALAALKIAVGMNPNADGSAVLSYQFLAADVNHDGKVKAADALNILKMAVDLPSAPANEWLFVPESVGSESMTRTHVVWPDNPVSLSLDADQELHLIGIVKGDIDGSWVA